MIIKDKEGLFRMIKVSIHQEDVPVLNVHASNNRTSKYTKQKTDQNARRKR